MDALPQLRKQARNADLTPKEKQGLLELVQELEPILGQEVRCKAGRKKSSTPGLPKFMNRIVPRQNLEEDGNAQAHHWLLRRVLGLTCLALGIAGALDIRAESSAVPFAWPEITCQTRPWTYWWWMGSAVAATNLTGELERYREAGLGGVHIIHGAKGFEAKFIDYLSPKWMEMLADTVTEAKRLGMGVDMTAGTGWCFGGPQGTDQEANASVVIKTFAVQAGGRLSERHYSKAIQSLVASSSEGKCVELTDRSGADGSAHWSPDSGAWQVHAVSQQPSGQKVKRAASGGQGRMLNLIYPEAMRHFLSRFDDAFPRSTGPRPRAMYHDSYDYKYYELVQLP